MYAMERKHHAYLALVAGILFRVGREQLAQSANTVVTTAELAGKQQFTYKLKHHLLTNVHTCTHSVNMQCRLMEYITKKELLHNCVP